MTLEEFNYIAEIIASVAVIASLIYVALEVRQNYENLYLQYLGGALDPRHWSGMAQHMRDVSSVPGMQAYWADRRHWFTEEFRKYWENEVLPAPADAGYRPMGTR